MICYAIKKTDGNWRHRGWITGAACLPNADFYFTIVGANEDCHEGDTVVTVEIKEVDEV